MDEEEYIYDDSSQTSLDGHNDEAPAFTGAGAEFGAIGIFSSHASSSAGIQLANGVKSYSATDMVHRVRALTLQTADTLTLDRETTLLLLARSRFKQDKLNDSYWSDPDGFRADNGVTNVPEATTTAGTIFDTVEMENVPVAECDVSTLASGSPEQNTLQLRHGANSSHQFFYLAEYTVLLQMASGHCRARPPCAFLLTSLASICCAGTPMRALVLAPHLGQLSLRCGSPVQPS